MDRAHRWRAAVCAALLAALPGLSIRGVLAAPASVAEAGRAAFVLVGEGSWLNIRERPKAHAPVVLRLTRGDELTLYRIDEDGWAEVSRAGDPGYCRAAYLCDALPTEAERMRVAAGRLNVRAAPAGDVLERLKEGAAVTVCGYLTDDDGIRWAHIGAGVVMAAYLAPMTEGEEQTASQRP